MDKRIPVLSKRMQAIARMVTPGNTAADIGCDHGYISIWLCSTGTCPLCIASDINAGPLEAARENAESFGASEHMELRLGPGLETVKAGEADTAVITGMGGLLIREILENSPDTVKSMKELVLSPQSDADKVREYLEKISFDITDEAFIFEDGKYYPVIKAKNTPPEKKLDEAELMFGPVLIKRKDETLHRYLKHREEIIVEITEKLAASGSKTALARKEELLAELDMIRKLL